MKHEPTLPAPHTLMIASFAILLSVHVSATAADLPATGEKAADFTLTAASGELSGEVTLSDLTEKGSVVVVVLRGFPGYQCPLCSRQVGEFIGEARAFANKKAKVLFIYPGPSSELNQRAKEFLKGTKLPSPFTLLLDPDYSFTNAYGLRWNAKRETAYPSTFVIDRQGTIQFAKISKTHGGRTNAAEVLKAMP